MLKQEHLYFKGKTENCEDNHQHTHAQTWKAIVYSYTNVSKLFRRGESIGPKF